LKNHISFRDILLQDSKHTSNYSQLKSDLTKAIGMTREKYTKQKTDFILNVLALNGFNKNELNEIKEANI
jgi:GrpB-like predicted nucleotidyltransferase (UPF0157 family)